MTAISKKLQKFTLTSPAKSEIGLIGKRYIDEINENIRRDISVNQ